MKPKSIQSDKAVVAGALGVPQGWKSHHNMHCTIATHAAREEESLGVCSSRKDAFPDSSHVMEKYVHYRRCAAKVQVVMHRSHQCSRSQSGPISIKADAREGLEICLLLRRQAKAQS